MSPYIENLYWNIRARPNLVDTNPCIALDKHKSGTGSTMLLGAFDFRFFSLSQCFQFKKKSVYLFWNSPRNPSLSQNLTVGEILIFEIESQNEIERRKKEPKEEKYLYRKKKKINRKKKQRNWKKKSENSFFLSVLKLLSLMADLRLS